MRRVITTGLFTLSLTFMPLALPNSVSRAENPNPGGSTGSGEKSGPRDTGPRETGPRETGKQKAF